MEKDLIFEIEIEKIKIKTSKILEEISHNISLPALFTIDSENLYLKPPFLIQTEKEFLDKIEEYKKRFTIQSHELQKAKEIFNQCKKLNFKNIDEYEKEIESIDNKIKEIVRNLSNIDSMNEKAKEFISKVKEKLKEKQNLERFGKILQKEIKNKNLNTAAIKNIQELYDSLVSLLPKKGRELVVDFESKLYDELIEIQKKLRKQSAFNDQEKILILFMLEWKKNNTENDIYNIIYQLLEYGWLK